MDPIPMRVWPSPATFRAMVLVEARALGKKGALIPEWSVPVPGDTAHGDSGLTLRQLIERVVRAEVDAFKQRQNALQFVRVLTDRELTVGRERGKIDPGGADLGAQELDPEHALATAMQGFEDGLYLVILDGTERKDLEEPVYLHSDSRLVFLRLTFLAGG